MKKSILIVSSSLATGGLEKCVINLCDSIDYYKYDVDLYLFNDGRDLLPKLNKHVTLLPDSPHYSDVYNRPLLSACRSLVKKRQVWLCLYRLFRTLRSRLHCNVNTRYDWKQMKKTMLYIDKHYDAAIGFEEGTAGYYIIDCVDANKKSCWVHTDLKAIDTNAELDETAFLKADYVCTVSENSANSVRELHPSASDKIKVFSLPSLYDTNQMFKLANEDAGFDGGYFNILSVGRLVELKGFRFCVEACRMLIDDGYKVRWYVAGEGDYRAELERRIKEFRVEGTFILLGNCTNPYKYIKSSNVCVQPSSYEGFSLVVYEEKLLKKPVIVSDIPSFREMVTDGKNGYIVERNADSIYLALKHLVDDSQLAEKLGKCPINGFVSKEETISLIEKTF